ncbi:uncharacterized protein LOC126745701 [Anthonomus grandis grandis]|uniref:uncharacterized protein LOC126745701 n=1 Tax=Anthonomus grandis grandis TaxID=2921223 RepID=UPI002165F5E2|nr:uncharacterized protein LOC126745701 [Anthonomus grandis grandis]
MVEKLNNKREEVIKLRSEIDKLMLNEELLKISISDQKEKISLLQKDLEEANSICKKMITSIRLLEAENQSYSCEIPSLKNDMEVFKASNSREEVIQDSSDIEFDTHCTLSTELDNPSSTKNLTVPDVKEFFVTSNPVNVCRKQVLVFGDQTARGVASRMTHSLDSKIYSIHGEVHSNYTLSQMANRIFELTTDYVSTDNIIVCLDLGSTYFDCHSFYGLLSLGKFTNLTLSLTYDDTNKFNYFHVVSICKRFLKSQRASVRIFSNNSQNNKFRISKSALCVRLVLFVTVSYALKRNFVLSPVPLSNVNFDKHSSGSNSDSSPLTLNSTSA